MRQQWKQLPSFELFGGVTIWCYPGLVVLQSEDHTIEIGVAVVILQVSNIDSVPHLKRLKGNQINLQINFCKCLFFSE